ncbi:unnamed protein product [Scytosiphon promiscuus]
MCAYTEVCVFPCMIGSDLFFNVDFFSSFDESRLCRQCNDRPPNKTLSVRPPPRPRFQSPSLQISMCTILSGFIFFNRLGVHLILEFVGEVPRISGLNVWGQCGTSFRSVVLSFRRNFESRLGTRCFPKHDW